MGDETRGWKPVGRVRGKERVMGMVIKVLHMHVRK
jgi:hypothetical protein